VSVTGKSETAGMLDALARIPAAVRFVSYEPALKAFDFLPWLYKGQRDVEKLMIDDPLAATMLRNGIDDGSVGGFDRPIGWLIVGGESGTAARPMVLGWAKDIVRQCQEAKIPVFVKQLGRHPTNREGGPHPLSFDASHGGDLRDFPEALRVREFPR
jgi:protein gp37